MDRLPCNCHQHCGRCTGGVFAHIGVPGHRNPWAFVPARQHPAVSRAGGWQQFTRFGAGSARTDGGVLQEAEAGAVGSARGWRGGGPFGFRTSLGLGDAQNKSTGVGEEEMDLRLFAFSQRHVLPMQASPWLPADTSGWSGHRGVAGSTGPSQLSGSFSFSHF